MYYLHVKQVVTELHTKHIERQAVFLSNTEIVTPEFKIYRVYSNPSELYK